MDNRFNNLKSWLLFELICTVGALIWTLYVISELRGYGSGMTQWETYLFCGVILLVLRIFFLGRAWWSFIPDDDDDDDTYLKPPVEPGRFSAKVFKPADDEESDDEVYDKD